MPTLCRHHSAHPLRHAVNERKNLLLRDKIPLLNYCLDDICSLQELVGALGARGKGSSRYISRAGRADADGVLKDPPEILNRIEVRGGGRPVDFVWGHAQVGCGVGSTVSCSAVLHKWAGSTNLLRLFQPEGVERGVEDVMNISVGCNRPPRIFIPYHQR